MEPEYIYCLKNEEMPNICKCGGTAKSPYNRCDEISNTSLPVKCEVAYFIEVINWKKAEKYVHKKIIDFGIKRFQGKEWFKCKPEIIKHIFDDCKKIYGFNYENIKIESQYIKVNDGNLDNKVINNKEEYKIYDINKKVKKYYCYYCDYSTNDSGNFSKHKKTESHIINFKKNNVIEKEKENQSLINKIKNLELEHKHEIKIKDMEINNLKEMVLFYKSKINDK